jgi:hypothetical protein
VQRRRRRAPAAACVTEIGDGSLQRFSRRLDPSVQRGMALRSRIVGQGCSGLAGGVQKGAAEDLPAAGLCSDSGNKAALGFVGRRLRMGKQGGAARATYRAAA